MGRPILAGAGVLGSPSHHTKDFITTKLKTIAIPLPPDYQVLRKDRNSKAHGGGVFIAVRKHFY